MTWTLYDVTTGTNFVLFNDAQIILSLHELDSATGSMVGTVTVDDYVYIKESGTNTEIFRGYIKNIEEQDTTKVKKLTIIESGNSLKDTIVTSGSSRSFILTGQTVRQCVDTILTGTGWVAGRTDTTSVPTIAFANISSYDALNKLLYSMFGYEVWFVDNGTTKTINWGTVRNTFGTVAYKKKIQTNDSNNRNVTDITILGNDDSITGSATTGNTPKKTRIFRNTTCKSTDECTKVATNVLSDYRNPRNRYTLTLAPTYIYNPCDQITVDGTNYIIRDITYTQSESKIGIGSYLLSYTDVYGSDLQEVTGSVSQGTDASWSGGNSNVSADGASYTQYTFSVKDIAVLTNLYLDATVGSFQVSTGVAATTEYLSEVSILKNSGAYTDTNWLTAGTHYFPDSTGVIVSNDDGHQFGLATMTGSFFSSGTKTVSIILQYSLNSGATWTNSVYNVTLTANSSCAVPVTCSGLISGTADSSDLAVRFKIVPEAGSVIRVYDDFLITLQSVPRHTHSVASTYDKTTTGTPPSTILVHMNSGSDVTLTPGTKQLLSNFGTLISGNNIIYIKTPTGSSGVNKCSVNPTITYQTVGKS